MDLYSTDTLVGVVQNLVRPSKWLLDRYFPKTTQDESEEIHFDVISGKRRIAPFVSPLVSGQIVESLGREVRSFKPAYIKDKRRVEPSQALKRAVGEKIGGSMSAQERKDAYIAAQLLDQIDMIDRRLELMASEALRTGKVTVEGEKYAKVVVDFKRTAAHSVSALAGTARWGQSAEDPLANLRTWSSLALKNSGAFPIDVVMGVDAYVEFTQNAEVKERLDSRNITNATMAPGAQAVEGGVYRGTIDGFNIYTYGGWYVDPLDNTEKEIFPADQVLLASPLVEGVRAYGAILDGKAGLQAMPYFPKMWEDNDPAVEWLMTQSAPLVVPTRPDATVCVDVL